MMSKRLGGISIPRTDDPATVPAANAGRYPWRVISGTATLVKTAADAMDTPVTAAKMVFAATVATPSPQIIRRNNSSATSKVSRPTFETFTRSPINTNSGIVAKR